MKGVFVHQQIEYRLEMPKDQVEQGDSLPCTLVLKNHGSAAQKVSDVRLEVACGDPKDLKNKTDDFELVSAATLSFPGEVAPQGQHTAQWTFDLDKNCSISDKSQTLFFRCGAESGTIGQLPITIKPHPHTEGVLQLLETSFQFVLKGLKSSKGWVEAKLKPPSSPRFSMVNELKLGFRFDGSALLLKFKFNVKKFETEDSAVKIGKGQTDVDKRLEESDYLRSGGYLNHEGIEAAIEDALKVVATGLER